MKKIEMKNVIIVMYIKRTFRRNFLRLSYNFQKVYLINNLGLNV